MTDKNLDEKLMSDDKVSSTSEPVVGAGGAIKKRRADLDKQVDPKAEKVTMAEEDEADDDVVFTESLDSLFEGMDLSEDFRNKVTLIFESAVNEAATAKFNEILEEVEAEFEEEMVNAVNESIEEIVENLDNYLDYTVNEWMKDNEIAIESGIKVQMAESLMESLKEVFYEHNINIDESDIDVVADLEEENQEIKNEANKIINENIELKEEVAALYATIKFNELSEGLTSTQKERMRVLAEKLDYSDLSSYTKDLKVLKETFFKKSDSSKVTELTESVVGDDEENEILVEDSTSKSRVSQFDTINSLVAALNAKI